MVRVVGVMAAVIVMMGGIGFGQASSQDGPEVFTLCTKLEGGFRRNVDVGKARFSSGDMVIDSFDMFDPETGERRGRFNGRLTVIRPTDRPLGITDATAQLEDGKIVLYASIKAGGGPGTFAITGGTGAYARARGTVTARSDTCAGDPGTEFVFELTLD